MTTNLTSVVLATITTSCLDYYNILLPYWTPASALNCIHFFPLHTAGFRMKVRSYHTAQNSAVASHATQSEPRSPACACEAHLDPVPAPSYPLVFLACARPSHTGLLAAP